MKSMEVYLQQCVLATSRPPEYKYIATISSPYIASVECNELARSVIRSSCRFAEGMAVELMLVRVQ